jgi:hypothetical protein
MLAEKGNNATRVTMMVLRTVLSTGFLRTILKFISRHANNEYLDWLLSHAQSKVGCSKERQITIHQECGFDQRSAINESVAWTPQFVK